MYHKDRAKVQQKNELCKQFSQKVYFLSNFLAFRPIALPPHRLIALSPPRPIAL
jgi:hypothetical protein